MLLAPETLRTALIDVGAWDAADPRNPASHDGAAVHLLRRFFSAYGENWIVSYTSPLPDGAGVTCRIYLQRDDVTPEDVERLDDDELRVWATAGATAQDSFAWATAATILQFLLQDSDQSHPRPQFCDPPSWTTATARWDTAATRADLDE